MRVLNSSQLVLVMLTLEQLAKTNLELRTWLLPATARPVVAALVW